MAIDVVTLALAKKYADEKSAEGLDKLSIKSISVDYSTTSTIASKSISSATVTLSEIPSEAVILGVYTSNNNGTLFPKIVNISLTDSGLKVILSIYNANTTALTGTGTLRIYYI